MSATKCARGLGKRRLVREDLRRGAVRVLPAPVWPMIRTARGVLPALVLEFRPLLSLVVTGGRVPSSAGTMDRSNIARDSSSERRYDFGSAFIVVRL